MIAENLKNAMDERGITIYRLSKMIGMKYELLRRVFSGERKLMAEELIEILDKTGISINEIK